MDPLPSRKVRPFFCKSLDKSETANRDRERSSLLVVTVNARTTASVSIITYSVIIFARTTGKSCSSICTQSPKPIHALQSGSVERRKHSHKNLSKNVKQSFLRDRQNVDDRSILGCGLSFFTWEKFIHKYVCMMCTSFFACNVFS